MKHTAKRLGAVCLLCVILSSCGAADRDTAAIKESTGEAIDTISSETATEKAGAIDDLPSDLNLNGEEVSFLYRDEIANEFYTAELNGDVVNDALYNSRVAVEDRLNAKINAILKPGHLQPHPFRTAGRRRIIPLALQEIGTVHPGGMDADEHLVVARRRCGYGCIGQRAGHGINENGVHRLVSFAIEILW